MSIFNFFKRKNKEEQKPTEKIKLDSINLFVNKEIKNIQDKSEIFKNELKDMTAQLSLKIKQKIPELKALNLDKRKEEQRLKNIVMDNLHEYISNLEKLAEDLEKTEPKEAEKYIKEIQFIFNRFSKSSRMIYERATILIGKQLAEVRSIIDNFAKEFNEKLLLNKENFEKINLIKTIQNNLEELEETKKIQKQIKDSINDFEIKTNKTEQEKQQYEKNYEEYQKGDEHRKFIEEQEKINQENKAINEEVLKLKQNINLKYLAKYFHEDQKKNKIIKNYSENFLNSLKEDNNFNLISLLREADQNTHEEKIKELKQRFAEQKELGIDKKLKELEDEVIKVNHKLKYEKEELEHEKIKKQRFEEKQKQILNKIKQEAKRIWQDAEIED